jgi:hypothetical protein
VLLSGLGFVFSGMWLYALAMVGISLSLYFIGKGKDDVDAGEQS